MALLLNGFVSLDIRTHQRYDANKTASGLTCCRPVITSLYIHLYDVYTEFGPEAALNSITLKLI